MNDRHKIEVLLDQQQIKWLDQALDNAIEDVQDYFDSGIAEEDHSNSWLADTDYKKMPQRWRELRHVLQEAVG